MNEIYNRQPELKHYFYLYVMRGLWQLLLSYPFPCMPVFRPATHPDLIGISRFFSANLEVSRFPDFTCGNPGFLFRFGRLTLLHGPCHQAHQAWAKNKFYDRLNPLHNATQGYPRLTMAPASHAKGVAHTVSHLWLSTVGPLILSASCN